MLFLTYWDEFLRGLALTAVASVVAFAIAVVLGVALAAARRSRFGALRVLATVYIEVFRNTPVLVQIFLAYFGLPAFGVHLPAIVAGVTALACNSAAYLAEIVRAGLGAVPGGQVEAAKALGLVGWPAFAHVTLPQALRNVYPPVVNQFVELILGSSLLSTISVRELTSVAQDVNSITFETIEVFAFALVLYLILTSLVSLGASWLGRRAFRPPLPVRIRAVPRRSARRRPLGVAR